MAKISIFGVLSNIQMLIHTSLYGKFVGKDGLGNKYYRGKARKGTRRERRWVIYPGEAEATLVPPEWHGWLHHQTDKVPPMDGGKLRKPWQLPHQPNQTGTPNAYMPSGHALKGGNRQASTGDIEAWQPPE
ncbi:MAG TPA: NADH:ubiquinone oxidoreductase subunit NDUFA12 [Patescibacteria group bacterium]|nr:NADH:ubiquinone oxidoreductase subunit NDUFA12 [Patescibacteria group bacterium]